MKPQRKTFEIATNDDLSNFRATRTGYVLGDFATHKEPGKGNYFWTFTHVPTGIAVGCYPWMPEKKADALAYLEQLVTNGAPQEHQRRAIAGMIADGRWGKLNNCGFERRGYHTA